MSKKLIIIAFLKRYYRYFLILLFFIGVISYYVLNLKNNLEVDKETIIVKNNSSLMTKEDIKEIQPTINLVSVDVKGNVIKPGVYYLSDKMRVIDAINMAGGLNSKADPSIINLSKKIFDEMVIIVYSKSEVLKFKEAQSNKEAILEPCICPDVLNDACINEDVDDVDQDSNPNLINLNTASLNELMTIPGIGEVKANEIINYRKSNGNFQKIEDLMNISGIGEATFAKIKDYFTL